MELIVDILFLFIVLNCAFKLSLWKLWQRLVFSLLLGVFAWWSVRYAVLMSKTQMANFLQNTQVLQTIAVFITIETAVGVVYCLKTRFLYFYPSLLMFPVVFYLLTQLIFTATGIDFGTIAIIFAVGIAIFLPLLSEGIRRLLPGKAIRMELHLMLTILVCILGLLATQHDSMVYVSSNQNYMDFIYRALFGIANSLLIPDVILLIFFFMRALILLCRTYSQYMIRRKDSRLLDKAIKELQPQGISSLKDILEQTNSLFAKYLKDMLTHPASEEYADFIINHYETETAKDVNLARLLTKLGPVLGLIGTLISMSPALVGLSTGDISSMAYNMQVVFSATVMGLVISAIGLFTQQLKSRWYVKDVNQLDYVSRIYQQNYEKEA